ncbi:hypothetical protein E6C60_1077 [Paenibacillus algicola]|uniref:Uncharacterized protein n=1 Tax=Paenibacillus algicola TaxID=2565926 RepID=A0A4P8XHF8_9BACL|nr:hypothetical protein [Paenibacillus algicola]QCT01795.1 hypothetical protein E6C60_1077 [Paenibacillus algicola]
MRAFNYFELLLNQLAAGDGNPGEINEKLKEKKIHKLDLPQDYTVTPMSQPSDVNMNAVNIYADGQTGNWYVTGGGSWNDLTWTADAPSFRLYPNVGSKKNVGGYDTVGITYYNTSGTYGTTVLSSQGYWHDGVGNSWSSYSPSHGDGKLGAAFDFQDKVRITKVNWDGSYSYVYEGKGFAATLTYTPNFVYYNGKARTFYGHTYNQATVDNVTFGASTGDFGVDIQLSNTSQGFKAFNNSDTNF